MANLSRQQAEEEAAHYRDQYDALTRELEEVRTARRELLSGAEMPLPGLSVEEGELVYGGARWDCMSGADQLRVGTAIIQKLNPQCGFVLLDKLEQMDLDTLKDFGGWLEQQSLQAIATRVSTGGECSVIIEEGQLAAASPQKEWKKGEF